MDEVMTGPHAEGVTVAMIIYWRTLERVIDKVLRIGAFTDVQVLIDRPGFEFPGMLATGGAFKVRDVNGHWHVVCADRVRRTIHKLANDPKLGHLFAGIRYAAEEDIPGTMALAFWAQLLSTKPSLRDCPTREEPN